MFLIYFFTIVVLTLFNHSPGCLLFWQQHITDSEHILFVLAEAFWNHCSVSVECVIRHFPKYTIITQQKVLLFLFLRFNIPRVLSDKTEKERAKHASFLKVSFICRCRVHKEKCANRNNYHSVPITKSKIQAAVE